MTIDITWALVAGEAGGCVAAADLFTGVFHWWEDRYGRESWPFVGKHVIAPNRLHHEQPRAFLANSWWQSASHQVVVAVVVAAGLLAAGALGWQAIVVLAVAVNANEVHKWAHRTAEENGAFVTALQRAGIVQSRAHHGGHHGGARDTRYCVVTPWLNPVLDRCGFWRGLERAIAVVTGIAPQVDAAVAARRERAVATTPSARHRPPRPPARRRPVGRYAALLTTAWGSAPSPGADPAASRSGAISAAGA